MRDSSDIVGTVDRHHLLQLLQQIDNRDVGHFLRAAPLYYRTRLTAIHKSKQFFFLKGPALTELYLSGPTAVVVLRSHITLNSEL